MLDLSFNLPSEKQAHLTSDQDLPFKREEQLLLEAYVPGISDPTRSSTANPEISIHHQESELASLTYSGTNMLLRDVWNGAISQDLYHLLYSATRVQLLESGLYSVHAACAGDDEQVLIVGHSGSGKTSTALELVRNHDWKLASGNKTVVTFDEQNRIQVCAGTSTMTVRDTDGERYATPLGKEIHDYGGRIAFSLDESRFVNVSERPLKAIVVVRLHDGLRDTHQLSPLSALHELYPYFMDSVNADTLVARGKGVFRAPALEEASIALSNGLQVAVSEIPVLSIAGPLSYVTEKVTEI
jgi:hypothetical protein